MKLISMTGASSFIGRYLLLELAKNNDVEIRVLVRKDSGDLEILKNNKVKIIIGDLLKPETLKSLIIAGSTVINLVYLWGRSKEENLLALDNLLERCLRVGIKRFIHVSTAMVTGRVVVKVVDERTIACPLNEYETTKLTLEKRLIEKMGKICEVVILRPTAVFGPEGKNLLKLANDLNYASMVINYMKSCLFNRRAMNLVYFDNVIAAICFLVNINKNINGEVFIISDDEDPLNNYRDLEKYLIRALEYKDYFLPRLPLPHGVLSFLLKLSGKTNFNPFITYSCQKIKDFGLVKPITFEQGLNKFVNWYKKQ
jgi:nucleoside-diphosphate-sugar epimerase